jgi:hypothetical protein
MITRCIIFLTLIFSVSFAQYPSEPIWPVKCNAIILKDNYELVVEDGLTGKFKVEQAIKIYNEKGKSQGHFVLHENKYIKIKDVKGRIADQTGKALKKLDDNDITKANVSPGDILYDDSKYQRIELEYHTYPYIVEFKFELELASLYYWPSWHPQYEIPVLESNYTIRCDAPFEFHKYEIGIREDYHRWQARHPNLDFEKYRATPERRLDATGKPGSNGAFLYPGSVQVGTVFWQLRFLG